MEDIKPIDKFTLDKYVKEEDDLLEYVKQVAMEFCPDVYEGTYILETQALDTVSYTHLTLPTTSRV